MTNKTEQLFDLYVADQGSCTCLTKTPEAKYHDDTCPHKAIQEAIDAIHIEPMGVKFSRGTREQAIESGSPIGFICTDGGGRHRFINAGDTIGGPSLDMEWFPVFLKGPEEQQPSDYLKLSKWELQVFQQLRATLGLSTAAGLIDVLSLADIRIRRLQHILPYLEQIKTVVKFDEQAYNALYPNINRLLGKNEEGSQ